MLQMQEAALGQDRSEVGADREQTPTVRPIQGTEALLQTGGVLEGLPAREDAA